MRVWTVLGLQTVSWKRTRLKQSANPKAVFLGRRFWGWSNRASMNDHP